VRGATPPGSDSDDLSKLRYVTVLLRLLVDGSGKVIRGELVAVDGEPGERFTGLAGLNRTLRGWLSRQPEAVSGK
jgi:hypothetical protein